MTTSVPKFSQSWLHRARWNILDLINIVGRRAIPTYLFVDVDMSWAEAMRQKLSLVGHKTTITAFVLKAIAIAQRRHPESRSVLLPFGRTVTLNEIVAGFTVEKFVGTQPAVFLGVIREPDTKSLGAIAGELRQHADSELCDLPHLHLMHRFSKMPWLFRRLIIWLGLNHPSVRLKYMGATFGLSSLGKFGVRALIPPCVSTSIFGVGEIEKRAVVRDDQVVIRPMMTLTLNFDHRLIDGAPAARFLSDIRELLQGGLEEYIKEEESGKAAREISRKKLVVEGPITAQTSDLDREAVSLN